MKIKNIEDIKVGKKYKIFDQQIQTKIGIFKNVESFMEGSLFFDPIDEKNKYGFTCFIDDFKNYDFKEVK